MIEPVGGETHDILIHTVLDLEQGDRLGMMVDDALHERLVESALHGCETLDGGRQLAVVARQNHTRGPADRNPAGRLKRLSRLVDEECTELHAVEQTVGTAHQRAGDDMRLAK